MVSHVVREPVPFEGLIDQMDQLWVLLAINRFVIVVIDVEHPLAVSLELNKGLVEIPYSLLYREIVLLKQEVLNGRLCYHIDVQVIESDKFWGQLNIAEIILFIKGFQKRIQDNIDEEFQLPCVEVHDWLVILTRF